MTYAVHVSSYDQSHCEWERKVSAGSKSAAMRKAWKIVDGCVATRESTQVTHHNGFTNIDIREAS